MKIDVKSIFTKQENKIGLFTLGLLGVIAFWITTQNSANPVVSKQDEQQNGFTIDTLIPRGHVLVPIELANAEPLSSLVGATAVVDLYTTSLDLKQKGRKIGSRLKLIRAPKNPQLYAVLVKESQSEKILIQTGPFFAVIQNHRQEGSKIQNQEKPAFEISYQR